MWYKLGMSSLLGKSIRYFKHIFLNHANILYDEFTLQKRF